MADRALWRPEVLLRQCREHIEKQAPVKEWPNLLAITQIMAGMRYDIKMITRVLGGQKMLTENPLLRQLFAEKTLEILHRHIIEVLEERFDAVPDNLASAIQAIQNEKKLESHFRYAIKCRSLKSFRERLGLTE
jgi:hypothetical protein